MTQESVLGFLFCLIYINDLSQGLIPETIFFVNDTFLFRNVNCVNVSVLALNSRCLKSVRYSEFLVSPYLVRMRENRDQENSEYGNFLRSDCSIKNARLAIAMENIRRTGGYFLKKKKKRKKENKQANKATHQLYFSTVLKLNLVQDKSTRNLLYIVSYHSMNTEMIKFVR